MYLWNGSSNLNPQDKMEPSGRSGAPISGWIVLGSVGTSFQPILMGRGWSVPYQLLGLVGEGKAWSGSLCLA